MKTLLKNFKHADDVMPKGDAKAILQYVAKIKTDLPLLEIGTFRGQTTELIAKYLKKLGKKNKIYTIDPFKELWPTCDYEKETRDRLKNYNVEVINNYSENVVAQIPDLSLTFIDGNHSTVAVKRDYQNYAPRLKNMYYSTI